MSSYNYSEKELEELCKFDFGLENILNNFHDIHGLPEEFFKEKKDKIREYIKDNGKFLAVPHVYRKVEKVKDIYGLKE